MIEIDEQTAECLQMIGLRNHSITSEYRIFGPPGTGKTTELSHHIRRVVARDGGDSLLATSFSKATAAELAGRDIPIEPDYIGTLHSHCYRALGRPAIAEVHAQEWNRSHPRFAITPVSRQIHLDGEDPLEDNAAPKKSGDQLLQQLNCRRGMMMEPEQWPADVRQFAAQWEAHKRSHHFLDFCDLIEFCQRDVRIAPGSPKVIVADEAQDLNLAQLTLIRKWSRQARYLVLVGDDDQTIYSWAGASPDALLNPSIPDDHQIFLKQSQRVPRAVHALAERLIRQVTRRQEKMYKPRPEDGAVHRLASATYRSPEYAILKSAEQHLAKGKTLMFLASCSYMLRPVVAALRKNAIPFHNPYRKSNGIWNPLRLTSPGSSARRVLALLGAHPDWGGEKRLWTRSELLLWVEWLRPSGILRDGAIQHLQAGERAAAVSCDELCNFFEPGALNSLLSAHGRDPEALLAWWQARLAVEFRKRAQLAADIAATRGSQGLVDDPQIIVGTIHSVKGGQADVVYLFPDLSKAGDAQYQQAGARRDSVLRTFYVGATRAREILYICSPAQGMAVTL